MASQFFYLARSGLVRAFIRPIGALVLSSCLSACNADRQVGEARHLATERDELAKRLSIALSDAAALREEGTGYRNEIRQLQANVADFKEDNKANKNHAAQLEKKILDNLQTLEARDLQIRAMEARIASLREADLGNKAQNAELGLLVGQYQQELAERQRQSAAVEQQLKKTQASANAGGATEQVLAENAALKQRNSQLEQQLQLQQSDTSATRINPVLIEQAKEHSRQAYKRFRTAEQSKRSLTSRKNREKATLALQQAQTELARLRNARAVHIVAPGETLMSIAGHHYRDVRRWPQILDANRHLLDRPEQTRPGLVLVIP